MRRYLEDEIKFQEEYDSLEKTLRNSLNFVELRRENFSTTSIKFTEQLQSICNEIERLFLIYAIDIDLFEFMNVNNFEECFYKMWEGDNDFMFSKVSIIGLDLEITPWCDVYFISENRPSLPSWWRDYKEIERIQGGKFKRAFLSSNNADLQNVLNALAALYILNIAYARYNNDFKVSGLFEIDGVLT